MLRYIFILLYSTGRRQIQQQKKHKNGPASLELEMLLLILTFKHTHFVIYYLHVRYVLPLSK